MTLAFWRSLVETRQTNTQFASLPLEDQHLPTPSPSAFFCLSANFLPPSCLANSTRPHVFKIIDCAASRQFARLGHLHYPEFSFGQGCNPPHHSVSSLPPSIRCAVHTIIRPLSPQPHTVINASYTSHPLPASSGVKL